jgi:hypothetical protein
MKEQLPETFTSLLENGVMNYVWELFMMEDVG